MTQEFETRVISIVAEILNLQKEEIDVGSKKADFPSWDSMQNLNIVLAIEQEFGVEFPPDAFGEITGVDSLIGVLRKISA